MKGRNKQARINEMLEDVRRQLSKLEAGRKNNLVQKNGVWNAYAKLEYAILLAKLEHDFETAGGFEYSRFDKTSEAEMLKLAIDYLESGKKRLNEGNIKNAINDLRKARDTLKLLVLKH